MIRTLTKKNTNTHIAALEYVLAKAQRPVQWLVIAHNDARLVRSVSSALKGQSAAVLEVSQDTWDFEDKEFVEAIEWAMQQEDIRQLVLVGSSQAGGAASRASLVSDGVDVQGKVGYERLLANVKQKSIRSAEAQEEFAGQVQQLSQLPILHDKVSNQELELYGLLYRPETGLFSHYDADKDTFQVLGA